MLLRALLAAAVSLCCIVAQGEDTKAQIAALARCDKEVRDYLGVLQFIRSSAGSQIGSQVAAGYLAEDTVHEIQNKQGSCAAAQLIRTKVASRRS